jgi:hypothetical protein
VCVKILPGFVCRRRGSETTAVVKANGTTFFMDLSGRKRLEKIFSGFVCRRRGSETTGNGESKRYHIFSMDLSRCDVFLATA